mmetsp:Transcript_2083/g.7754  ORF Transcript_2083/g.7754 Transcript_2083/m.7754 type:complete len:286 (+) Transcript_2083:733-1590(+)
MHICEPEDMKIFHESEARRTLLSFVEGVCDSLSNPVPMRSELDSECLKSIEEFLGKLEARVAFYPKPVVHSRFGDPNFRLWHEYVLSAIPDFIKGLSFPIEEATKVDITAYLQNSFGSPARLDYGTGHELNFIAFLCCLELLSVLDLRDRSKVALKIFVRYTGLTRTIQQYFRLEPAGSLGAWGLDDYCFIPFLWYFILLDYGSMCFMLRRGSAQLQIHSSSAPNLIIADPLVVEEGNMFFDSCRYVKLVKGGPLEVVSPTLASLSTVKSWKQMTEGLFKMYCVS